MTQKRFPIRSQQDHPLNVMIFASNGIHVLGTFPFLYFNYVLGTHGYCTFSGTKMQCTDSLSGKQVTLEIQVKACRRPVRIDIKLDMLDQTFRKKLDGSQDIPLPGLSIGGFGIVLNVFADPYDNGDLYLRVRFWNRVRCYLSYKSNHQITI